ncbi:MAG: hypothetical protein GY763_07925, partial [Gammaproteobacteria bacterium]|nr:hypothetical protein [Gammaproteobacteria bacterium]
MKNIFLLVLLVGVGYFGWNEVSKSKPDWFLKFVANTPIFDTAVSINFNAHKNWTEQSLQSEFENLFLVCANEQSKLGDRVCWTYISKFNDMPANAIAFFFKKNKHGYLRVSSNIENHNRIKDYLDNTYKYL